MHLSRLRTLLLVVLIASLSACIDGRRDDTDDDDDGPEDSDSDGVADDEDACPEDPLQSTDADGDGHCDEADDACPEDPNQWTDADGDTHCDEVDDGCPDDPTGWTDADGDTHCDEVDDACPDDPLGWTDADGDTHCDEADDACPDDPLGWTDEDGDTHCDEDDDACPLDPNQWTDADGDGVCDEVTDECPDDANGWVDSNGDGDCNELDDTDGDGIADGEEEVYGVDCAISDPLVADTDLDGYGDNEDLYPRDPYPEYILFRNDLGTIDLVLSNRDGTFQTPVEIGLPFGDTGNTIYRYTAFAISDFDGNGGTDFLAVGDSDPDDSTNPVDLWWFGRVAGPTSFTQRLVEADISDAGLHTMADLDNDGDVDLAKANTTTGTNNFIATATMYSYLNQQTVQTANCAWTDDATNPDGCAFVRVEAIDLDSWAGGAWVLRTSKDAVDVDGDGYRDLIVVQHSSGGDASIDVTLLLGNGDGTFTMPNHELFVHNAPGISGQSPVNSIVFDDFDLDGLGDVIIGLDDDGDAGSGWFYPGVYTVGTGFHFDTTAAFESFDVNLGSESGGDNAGFSTSAAAFDFDFDGNLDLVFGYNYTTAWDPPSQAVILRGLGNGSFQPEEVIRSFPSDSFANSMQIPRRLCQRFAIAP